MHSKYTYNNFVKIFIHNKNIKTDILFIFTRQIPLISVKYDICVLRCKDVKIMTIIGDFKWMI